MIKKVDLIFYIKFNVFYIFPMNTVKKLTRRAAIGAAQAAALASPFAVKAQSFTVDPNDPFGVNFGSNTGLGTKDIRDSIVAIINVALSILGIVALLIILWGGLTWMTAGGDEEKTATARKIIASGVVGLIIIFVAYALTTFIFGVFVEAT